MKNGLLFLGLMMLFQNFGNSQNEFGAVGSFWRYAYESHSGDADGWTIISIEKDTIIDSELYKQYRRKHYYKPFTGPAVESSSIGYLQIKNDSVYTDGELILDFDMDLTDSLYLRNAGGVVDIQLAIDSISTEEIGGRSYKKWFGQKICLSGPNGPEPYESFTILESVGQIDGGYLFWNTDNCSIGGGFNYFTCYQNGDFTYPPTQECENLFLSDRENLLDVASIEIFPNPVSNLLNIQMEDTHIEEITILDIAGKIIKQERAYNNSIQINVSDLNEGIYLIKVSYESRVFLQKFLKI